MLMVKRVLVLVQLFVLINGFCVFSWDAGACDSNSNVLTKLNEMLTDWTRPPLFVALMMDIEDSVGRMTESEVIDAAMAWQAKRIAEYGGLAGVTTDVRLEDLKLPVEFSNVAQSLYAMVQMYQMVGPSRVSLDRLEEALQAIVVLDRYASIRLRDGS